MSYIILVDGQQINNNIGPGSFSDTLADAIWWKRILTENRVYYWDLGIASSNPPKLIEIKNTTTGEIIQIEN